MALVFVMSVFLIGAMVGCPADGGGGQEGSGEGSHDEEVLSAHVEATPVAASTLGEVSFEVHIEDEGGHHVMDMAEVHLEVRAVGSDTWREIELTAMTDHYMGTRTFTSSGDYELRITGMEHMGHELEEMHLSTMTVARAHADIGLYHIQYENTPGHIHEGDTVTVSFWVALDDGGDLATGLAAQIVVEESDASETTVTAVEGDPGVYSADMTFAVAGDAHVSLQFTGSDSSPVEADFQVHVASLH